MMQLNRLFRDNGLYKMLDYSAEGTTYDQSGVTIVKCDLYTPEAQALEDQILKLRIDLGEDNAYVTIALQQITSEESNTISISDKHSLIGSLISLDAQRWETLDDYTILNTRERPLELDPIFITSTPNTKPQTLRMTFGVDNTVRADLFPLFNFIARMLSHTVSDVLGKDVGYYSGELHGDARPLRVVNEMISSDENTAVSAVLDSSLRAIRDICTDSAVQRLSRELSEIDYKKSAWSAPDMDRILEETEVLVGSAGWASVATSENILRVLDHMSLSVEFGSQSISGSVIR